MELRHWFAISAMVGGLALLLAPVVYAVFWIVPVGPYEVFLVLSPVLLAFGLYGYYLEFKAMYSWKGKAGTVVAGLGLIGTIPILTHRTIAMYTLPQGVIIIGIGAIGILLLELGVIAIAIDVWQTEAMPPWLWPMVALGPLLGLVADYLLWAVAGSTFLTPLWWGVRWLTGVYGLIWIGLGYYLYRGTQSRTSS